MEMDTYLEHYSTFAYTTKPLGIAIALWHGTYSASIAEELTNIQALNIVYIATTLILFHTTICLLISMVILCV